MAVSVIGFIANAADGAHIKGLTIEGSTFSGKNAGGIIANVNEQAKVFVENSSYQTYITATTSGNAGGLIGTVSNGSKVVVSNSFAKVTLSGGSDKGGLVGYVAAADVDLNNCYFLEATTLNFSNPTLIGAATASAIITTDNIACYTSFLGLTAKCTDEVKTDGATTFKLSGVNILGSTNAVTNFYGNHKEDGLHYDAETIETLYGNQIAGVEFETEIKSTEEGKPAKKITIAKTTTTLTDSKELSATFNIPVELNVDEVQISRSFTANRWSTIILPFTFVDSETDGLNTKETTNAKFYTLTGMNIVSGKWQVQAQRIKTLEANKPYLILPAKTGTLTFSGKVSLKQTTAGTSVVKDQNETDWTFVGVYEAKRWDVDHPPFDENNPKGFQVYGFAGQDQSDKGISAGNFVKVGYNVQIQPLRAYLYYPGYEANPDEANPTPNPSGMPALNKAPRALAKAAAESFELPDNIEVIINEDPIVIESLIIPSAPVVEDDSTNEGNDEEQEVTTGIAKPVAAPMQNRQANWYDLKGRRMGNKPQALGTYIKNRTPIIVK